MVSCFVTQKIRRGHGPKTEAGSATRRGKGVGTLGPYFSRSAATASDGSTEKSTQVISGGGGAPRVFVWPVWYGPTDPYYRFSRACCVGDGIGRTNNAGRMGS